MYSNPQLRPQINGVCMRRLGRDVGVPRQKNFKYILLKVHQHGRQLLCCFNPQGLSENAL